MYGCLLSLASMPIYIINFHYYYFIIIIIKTSNRDLWTKTHIKLSHNIKQIERW